jgi:CRP/FNR family transcriptional regulator
MTSSSSGTASQKVLVDPLAFLPCSTVMEFKKGRIIYEYDQPCENLYLILSGIVKISRIVAFGGQLLLDLYRSDDFFGDLALLNPSNTAEQAVAYAPCSVMTWRTADIEDIVMARPKLGIALLQAFGQRSLGFTQRIESLCFESIEHRLARCLIRFADHLGTPQPDGKVLMEPLTHELLSQYVGTSREVVTCHMTGLRRLGYLQYSRKMIVVHSDAMREWLERSSTANSTSRQRSASVSGADAV